MSENADGGEKPRQLEEEEVEIKVGTLELFFDLVIVVVIHNIAETIAEVTLHFEQVLVFAVRVFSSWYLWHASVMWLNGWQMSTRRTPGLPQQCCLALPMGVFAFMASATTDDDDGVFLSMFISGHTLVVAAVLSAPLRKEAKYIMSFSAVFALGLLVPAAYLSSSDHDVTLALWGSWAGFLVLSRVFGGYFHTQDLDHWICEDHLIGSQHIAASADHLTVSKHIVASTFSAGWL